MCIAVCFMHSFFSVFILFDTVLNCYIVSNKIVLELMKLLTSIKTLKGDQFVCI